MRQTLISSIFVYPGGSFSKRNAVLRPHLTTKMKGRSQDGLIVGPLHHQQNRTLRFTSHMLLLQELVVFNSCHYLLKSLVEHWLECRMPCQIKAGHNIDRMIMCESCSYPNGALVLDRMFAVKHGLLRWTPEKCQIEILTNNCERQVWNIKNITCSRVSYKFSVDL